MGLPRGTKRTPCWASTTPARARRSRLPAAVAIASPTFRVLSPAKQFSCATLPQLACRSSGRWALSLAPDRALQAGLEPPARMNGCNATRQVAKADAAEPGVADHAGKALLIGEGADAFDQIPVGLCRAGGQCPQTRDDLKGMKVVEAIEHG